MIAASRRLVTLRIGSRPARTARDLSRFAAVALALGTLALAAGVVSFQASAPAPALSVAEDHLPSPDGHTSGAGAAGPSYLAQSLAAYARHPLPIPGIEALANPFAPLARWLGAEPLQGENDPPPVSDGQFVWGPNVGRFDIAGFLTRRGSPLAPHAPDLALWASYSSVNPKLLLAALEFRYGLVSSLPAGWTSDDVLAAIEDTAMTMATAYYQHLHTWGERRPEARRLTIPPVLLLEDGSLRRLDPTDPSGTFALAAFLARFTDAAEFDRALAVGGAGGFDDVFGSLFPTVDLQSTANEIDPPGTPPANLLQFPFAMGATWTFGGPHSWNGNSTPPFSSMDFFIGGSTCAAPAYQFSVAAASGTAYRPWGYSCWLEIDHGAGWVTSYYHLQNLTAAASAERNDPLGTIACEICAGGFATGPHVHFSLKYNGAYVSLEGVELSGWTVHVGTVAYNSGSIERDGVSLGPYSQVRNDYNTYFGSGINTSLEFLGGAPPGLLWIPVDDPANARPGPPVDVGAGDDFMIDFWLRAVPGANPAPPVTCGANQAWTSGNIVLDRRRTGGAGYGIALAGGRPVFGVTGPGLDSLTLCGATDIADGRWHLITVARNRWDGVAPDGFLWLFVDGRLEASGAGPRGDISYPDSAAAGTVTDPYLALGGDKIGPGAPFIGWIDDLRFSNVLRTRVDFAPPTAPFAADSATLALFSFDEGAGNVVYDTSGFGGGPSRVLRIPSGSPAGPVWSADHPFAPPSPTPTATSTASPTSTPSPTPTATPSPSWTASPTSTITLTPTPSPSATATGTATFASSPTPSATASSTPPPPTPSPTPTATPTVEPTPTPAPTASLVPTATPGGAGLLGDVSLDGAVNVLDVQLCVNVILGSETDPDVAVRSDINGDGRVNVLDVQAIVNIILAG